MRVLFRLDRLFFMSTRPALIFLRVRDSVLSDIASVYDKLRPNVRYLHSDKYLNLFLYNSSADVLTMSKI